MGGEKGRGLIRPYSKSDALSGLAGDPHPDDILAQLQESLLSDKSHEESLRKRQAARMHQRLPQLRRRLELACVDRLDGKIAEEFWEATSAEWQEEEQAPPASLRELEQAENPERALDRVRILELANRAHSLYVTQTPAEKRNC